jgi:hypothetical protein
MSDKVLDDEQMRRLIAARAEQMGGISKLAAAVGVSYAFMHNVVSGSKAPGNRVLDYLGYEVERTRTYRLKGETKA